MSIERTNNVVWTWRATGAGCSFAGGMAAALIGSVLTAATWIVGAQLHPWLRGTGTTLLVLTIPLLIMAGYCMDWVERDVSKPNATSPNAEPGMRLSQR